jgi:hypothetical protein
MIDLHFYILNFDLLYESWNYELLFGCSETRGAPTILSGAGGADPEAIYNLRLILKIVL